MYHTPVMLHECLEALDIRPDGTYIDATFGGGGHSLAILEHIKGGRLIAFDQDADAQAEASKINHRSFIFCKANFRHMKQYLKLNGITSVDGILADLGVSSHQFDSAQRGFSTRFEGPLDMRMDQSAKTTAAKVVNESSEEELHKILGMYGEIKNARTAAREIVTRRAQRSFVTTSDLKSALQTLAPRGKENKYFAQVFQALRLVVNEELRALENFLHQCAEVIVPGGRLVVMSYHSLEDRIVKNFIQTGKFFGEVEKDFYGNPIRPFEPVNRKVIEASEAEIEKNNRARSAKLRIAKRTEIDSKDGE